MLKRSSKALLLALAAALAAFPAEGRVGAEASRAEEVLRQARAALGGEAKVRGVSGLTIKGKFRRVIQEREMSGERELDLLLPDKYMRTESLVVPGMATSMTNSRAVSGREFWASGGGGRGGMVIMMRSDGKEPTPEQKERAEREQARQLRNEMARYVLALLLTPPESFPVQFSYAGEATADDGSAEVIDATGPEGFSARLFLDKQTHLPLMLTYRAQKPRVMMMTMQGGGHGGGGGKSPEELRKEAEEKLKAQAEQPPEEVEMQVRFSDYKETAGLLLPHHISVASDGETTEEFEIKSYTVNPQFKTDKFQKK
jgi:hypothetical protein